MIYIKNKKDIEIMREACALTKAALYEVGKHIKPGITTKELDRVAFDFIKKNAVMCIALVAAIVTSIIIPVDKEYVNYFDYKTLTCLCSLTTPPPRRAKHF